MSGEPAAQDVHRQEQSAGRCATGGRQNAVCHELQFYDYETAIRLQRSRGHSTVLSFREVILWLLVRNRHIMLRASLSAHYVIFLASNNTVRCDIVDMYWMLHGFEERQPGWHAAVPRPAN
jgi:hypothetical protein